MIFRRTAIVLGLSAGLGFASATAQVGLTANDIVSSLQGIEAATTQVNAAALHRLALQSLQDQNRVSPANREPLSEQLNKLSQVTFAIQFDSGSARIRPESFKAIGAMADALYHPYLLGYRFLVVGHTDAVGDRAFNLKLSQQRADAIRDALIDPFGIDPRRLEAVGLGEEQLLIRTNPKAAENRRAQLINIGK